MRQSEWTLLRDCSSSQAWLSLWRGGWQCIRERTSILRGDVPCSAPPTLPPQADEPMEVGEHTHHPESKKVDGDRGHVFIIYVCIMFSLYISCKLAGNQAKVAEGLCG